MSDAIRVLCFQIERDLGLAAQTGIVMIVFHKRQAEGGINNLKDIIAAHMEGTVQRVRPKLMTVSTMLIGLAPLVWATSSGSDVMKRIAAPMGGLLTSAFLTLEIIPVVMTYWRQEQLLWQRLVNLAPERLRGLKLSAAAIATGASLAALIAVARINVTIPGGPFAIGHLAAAAIFLGGVAVYLFRRPGAYEVVWPEAPRS